jgi:negative regulator of genetic competence, sporulation and motility
MEVLKISDSKVKIMLSYADITKFRLQDGELNYDDPKTRRKIFDILDCVKKHHGFDYEGDKLLIQFYPSKDGGAELFVTKLGILSPESAKVISKSDKITLLNAKRSIYVFESFVDLL